MGLPTNCNFMDVDVLVAMILQLGKSMEHRSPLWGDDVKILGRTLDLSSAYKQLGAFMEERWQRIIVVYDPISKAPRYFLTAALMFGSVAAVYGFNRVSRSLWHIMAVKLRLLHTVYYDDFPSVEFEATAESAARYTAELLDLLGWKFAREGKKAKPFAETFEVLGVQIKLSELYKGQLVLQNKPSRIVSLQESVHKFLERRRVHPGEAASIHGILNFTQGQLMGAPLKPAMQFFSRVSSEGWDDSLVEELLVVCAFAGRVLQDCKPRIISLGAELRPVLLFTDGAWEAGATKPAGAGLVLIDQVTGTRIVHSIAIPDAVTRCWSDRGKAQLIAELELIPIVVAFETYKSLLSGRRVLMFVDNNAIRDAVAKGSSKAISIFVLLAQLHWLVALTQCMPWISRVPTKSNIGDLPSRDRAADAAKLLGAELGPELVPSQQLCDMITGGTSFFDYMAMCNS